MVTVVAETRGGVNEKPKNGGEKKWGGVWGRQKNRASHKHRKENEKHARSEDGKRTTRMEAGGVGGKRQHKRHRPRLHLPSAHKPAHNFPDDCHRHGQPTGQGGEIGVGRMGGEERGERARAKKNGGVGWCAGLAGSGAK